MYVYACVQCYNTQTHRHTRPFVRIHIHTYTHTHTNKHTLKHIHARTYVCSEFSVRPGARIRDDDEVCSNCADFRCATTTIRAVTCPRVSKTTAIESPPDNASVRRVRCHAVPPPPSRGPTEARISHFVCECVRARGFHVRHLRFRPAEFPTGEHTALLVADFRSKQS